MAFFIDQEYHNREFQPRVRTVLVIITLAFLGLVLRLWYIQVIKGDDFVQFAARNSFKSREIPASRGIIFDAQGNRIADVRPSFNVVIFPDRIPRPPQGHESEQVQPGDPVDIRAVASTLSRYLGIDAASIQEKYYSVSGRARFKEVVIKSDVTRDEISLIEAHRIDLPGVDIQVSQKRTYPYGELFSHLVGYLGEVQREELVRLRDAYRNSRGEDFYEIGDFIGKYGVEKQYESWLKGRDGVYYVQEDASGRVVNAFDERSPDQEAYARTVLAYLSERRRASEAGNDLVLTVDLELQRYVKDVLGDHVGALVAMDPNSGKILAMYSSPSFDPEIFARGISQEDWERLRDDPAHPLDDKSLRGQYPPGSTFKMVTEAAGLMERVISSSTQYYCSGSLKIGGRKFRCHKAGGHAFVNAHAALVSSCDVFFYSMSPKLGADRLARYARAFGFGNSTGLGLNQEKAGLVPTEAWKLKLYKQPWMVGDTVSSSVGQGFYLVTPLQLARYTAAIANDGRLFRPYLVEQIRNEDGQVVQRTEPEVVGTLPVSRSALRVIQNGMLGVIEERSGTAHGSQLRGVRMAGKTGTAQVVAQKLADLGKETRWEHRDHALFTAYAPFEKPEIVVSVVLEHGGHGGQTAAPVARAVIRRFLEDRGRIPKSSTETAKADTAAPSPEGVGTVVDAED